MLTSRLIQNKKNKWNGENQRQEKQTPNNRQNRIVIYCSRAPESSSSTFVVVGQTKCQIIHRNGCPRSRRHYIALFDRGGIRGGKSKHRRATERNTIGRPLRVRVRVFETRRSLRTSNAPLIIYSRVMCVAADAAQNPIMVTDCFDLAARMLSIALNLVFNTGVYSVSAQRT